MKRFDQLPIGAKFVTQMGFYCEKKSLSSAYKLYSDSLERIPNFIPWNFGRSALVHPLGAENASPSC